MNGQELVYITQSYLEKYINQGIKAGVSPIVLKTFALVLPKLLLLKSQIQKMKANGFIKGRV